eukprot:scaffold34606_cov192-Amphora_coffeaeformis.AAC.8
MSSQQYQQHQRCEQQQQQREEVPVTVQISLLDMAPLICLHNKTTTARQQQQQQRSPFSSFGRQEHDDNSKSRQILTDILTEALEILDDDDFVFSD